MTRPGPVVVCVLGGVASGKSTVARLLGERGARVVDADALAREVLGEEPVKEELRRRFGPGVFDERGAVRREALAEAAFGGDGARAADLDAATHPAILARVEAALAAAGPSEAVVLDLPLLWEAGLSGRCTVSVFVEAPRAARRARAAARGWAAGELERREALQADLGAKRRAAGIVIKNDKDLDALENHVTMVWDSEIRPLLSPHSDPTRR